MGNIMDELLEEKRRKKREKSKAILIKGIKESDQTEEDKKFMLEEVEEIYQ